MAGGGTFKTMLVIAGGIILAGVAMSVLARVL